MSPHAYKEELGDNLIATIKHCLATTCFPLCLGWSRSAALGERWMRVWDLIICRSSTLYPKKKKTNKGCILTFSLDFKMRSVIFIICSRHFQNKF